MDSGQGLVEARPGTARAGEPLVEVDAVGGESLGSSLPALVVNDTGLWAHADLHHGRVTP